MPSAVANTVNGNQKCASRNLSPCFRGNHGHAGIRAIARSGHAPGDGFIGDKWTPVQASKAPQHATADVGSRWEQTSRSVKRAPSMAGTLAPADTDLASGPRLGHVSDVLPTTLGAPDVSGDQRMRLLLIEDNQRLVANRFNYFEPRGHFRNAAPAGT